MKRKLFALLTAAAALLALAGCQSGGGEETQAPADRLEQIRQKGEIVIATEGTWAPWTYHDADGNLVGYDVEVAQAIADKLGVTANFAEGEWDSLLAGIDSGRYDIVANGVDIDESRREKYDFSIPYAYNRVAVIVRGEETEIDSLEALEGKTTANTLNSTYAALAESYGATVTPVDDLDQTIELLLYGRIDATLNSEVTFYDYMNVHPDANLKVAALTEDATQVAIPMRKGEETRTLREAIDQALSELAEDGTLRELSIKYFGNDISQGT